jgi:uncharacterized damage-inducible protein DinB
MSDMNRLLWCSLLFLAASSFADEPKGFRADLLAQIAHVEKQILDLENAIPDEKMTWRPAEGVRSISEVYMHIAWGNYLLAQVAGFKLPDDITMPESGEMAKAEAATTNKKEIAGKLQRSFDFLKGAIGSMTDEELERPVTFFGQKTNVRGMLLITFAHHHEHLGQSIAYARMNGIVPPWTAAQQEAAARQKKK